MLQQVKRGADSKTSPPPSRLPPAVWLVPSLLDLGPLDPNTCSQINPSSPVSCRWKAINFHHRRSKSKSLGHSSNFSGCFLTSKTECFPLLVITELCSQSPGGGVDKEFQGSSSGVAKEVRVPGFSFPHQFTSVPLFSICIPPAHAMPLGKINGGLLGRDG